MNVVFPGKEEVEEQDVPPLSDKVSLYKGDITILEVDAIVNAGKFVDLFTFFGSLQAGAV